MHLPNSRILPCIAAVLLVMAAFAGANAQANIDEKIMLMKFLKSGHIAFPFGIRGTIWTDFPNTDHISAEAAILDNDGNVVVAGWTELRSDLSMALVRYLPDGRRDKKFNMNGRRTLGVPGCEQQRAFDVAVDLSDNSLIVAGETFCKGKFRAVVARVAPNGLIDKSFGADGYALPPIDHPWQASAQSVTVDGNGKIVLAVQAFDDEKNKKFVIMRLNSDGTYDKSLNGKGWLFAEFPPAQWVLATRVLVHPDGDLIAGGTAIVKSPHEDKEPVLLFALGGFNADGTRKVNFGAGGTSFISYGAENPAVLEDIAFGRSALNIILAGTVQEGEKTSYAVASYEKDGSPSNNFGSEGKRILKKLFGNIQAGALSVRPDGRILLAGIKMLSSPNISIVRLLPNGEYDEDFDVTGYTTHPCSFTEAMVGGLITFDNNESWVVASGDVVDKLPPRFEINEVLVESDLNESWPLTDGNMKDFTDLCNKFNQLIYDALDGQVSVMGFRIVDWGPIESNWQEEYGVDKPYVWRTVLSTDFDNLSPLEYDNTGDPLKGRPENPMPFKYGLVGYGKSGYLHLNALALFRGWAATYCGAFPATNHKIEVDGQSFEGTVLCPQGGEGSEGYDKFDMNVLSEANVYGTELCRYNIHNKETLQEKFRGMSGYEWLAKSLNAGIFVPAVEIEGPDSPPTPYFVYRSDHHILPTKVIDRLETFDDWQLRSPAMANAILVTPEGKKINMGVSRELKEGKSYSGHAAGTFVANVEGGKKVDSIHVYLRHKWCGDIGSISKVQTSFHLMPGGYSKTLKNEQLTASERNNEAEFKVKDVSNVVGQYWHTVTWGGCGEDAGYSRLYVSITVYDNNQKFDITLSLVRNKWTWVRTCLPLELIGDLFD